MDQIVPKPKVRPFSRVGRQAITLLGRQIKLEEAMEIARRQVTAIAEHWDAVCEEAAISKTDRSLLATRQFLNAFSMEGLSGEEVRLK